jgi:hypothetical protein
MASYRRRCRHCGRLIQLRRMPGGQWVAFEGYEQVHDCTAPPSRTIRNAARYKSPPGPRVSHTSDSDVIDAEPIIPDALPQDFSREPAHPPSPLKELTAGPERPVTAAERPSVSRTSQAGSRRLAFWLWLLIGFVVLLLIVNHWSATPSGSPPASSTSEVPGQATPAPSIAPLTPAPAPSQTPPAVLPSTGPSVATPEGENGQRTPPSDAPAAQGVAPPSASPPVSSTPDVPGEATPTPGNTPAESSSTPAPPADQAPAEPSIITPGGRSAEPAPPANTPISKGTTGFFTIGSTEEEVRAIQGVPPRIDNYGQLRWWYGLSTVTFDSSGRVSRYDNASGNLHVRLVPKEQSSATYFTLGSNEDEVLS